MRQREEAQDTGSRLASRYGKRRTGQRGDQPPLPSSVCPSHRSGSKTNLPEHASRGGSPYGGGGPEWHIAAFSREYSRLTRTLDAYCPEHYILYLERGIISVKTPVSPDLCEEELAAFEAEPYEFDEDEKARLKKGAAFDSLVEADRFLTEHKKEGG